jgi:hypothetical protein
MASLHRSERDRRSRLALLLPIAAVLVGSRRSPLRGRLDWQSVARAVGIGSPAEPAHDAVTPAPPAAAPGASPRRVQSRCASYRRRAHSSRRQRRARAYGCASPASTPAPPRAAAPVPAAAAPAAATAPSTVAETALPAAQALEQPAAKREVTPPVATAAECPQIRLSSSIASPTGCTLRPVMRRALAAWDKYLCKSAARRFALEASYNRAICLVRLGRNAEARRALELFARGSYGPIARPALGRCSALGGG